MNGDMLRCAESRGPRSPMQELCLACTTVILIEEGCDFCVLAPLIKFLHPSKIAFA